VKALELSRGFGRSAGAGASILGAIGSLVGLLAGLQSGSRCDPNGTFGDLCGVQRAGEGMKGLVIGAAAGAALGALIGHFVKTEHWATIQ